MVPCPSHASHCGSLLCKHDARYSEKDGFGLLHDTVTKESLTGLKDISHPRDWNYLVRVRVIAS